jgi:tetratricopeptide (TPR) repeat protein
MALTSRVGGRDTGRVKKPEESDTADSLLMEAGTVDPLHLIQLGIEAARAKKFDRGLVFLGEATLQLSRDKDSRIPPAALSYYGLCLAMQKGRNKEAAEYCELALEREFFNVEHYVNLGQVWINAGHRRKAVDALDRGLAIEPGDPRLRMLRESVGVRKPPVLGFLPRDNPVNVSLGKVRRKIKKPGPPKGPKG